MLRISVAALSALCVAACGGERRAAAASRNTGVDARGRPVWLRGNQDPGRQGHQALAADRRAGPGETYVAVVETNCGFFEITLDAKRAPKTAASFMSLAIQKFYNGTTIHRIVPAPSSRAATRAAPASAGPAHDPRAAAEGPEVHEGRRGDGKGRSRAGRDLRLAVLHRHRPCRSSAAARVRIARQDHQRRGRRRPDRRDHDRPEHLRPDNPIVFESISISES